MGLFNLLTKKSRGEAPKAKVNWREDSFPIGVVGESFYQDKLVQICGRHRRHSQDVRVTAVVRLESENKNYPEALVVEIGGAKVGHVSSKDAVRLRDIMVRSSIVSFQADAKIVGGWRTNQYDEGSFGVRLGIPMYGWIDFGLGLPEPDINEYGWPKQETPARPKASDSGKLLGERIAIIGDQTDGDLANLLAAHGGHIMASFGKTTTMLVVEGDSCMPYCNNQIFIGAFEAQQNGRKLKIITSKELMAQLK